MALSLRKIEVLAVLAREEGVSAAARKLGLTQSAVSMALAELEREAGGPLFRRAGRRMIPGERGRSLAEEAEKVLSLVARMEELLEPSGELRGVLRIGASTTIGNYLLPSLLAAFREANPLVRLAMEVANTSEIAARLEAGDLDLACVEGPVRSANLKVTDWRGDRLAVIAAPGHPWTREPPSAADLAAAPWIMREKGSGTREVFEAAMRAAALAPNVLGSALKSSGPRTRDGFPSEKQEQEASRIRIRRAEWGCFSPERRPLSEGSLVSKHSLMELGHTEAIKKAVEANLGVGCLSILAVQRELEAGTLAEVPASLDLKRRLTILTDAREAPGRIAAACMKALLA
jgi:DNA-binding transcriptional LysR family regulator